MEETNCFHENLFFSFMVRRAFALWILNEDNLEWQGDRLNALSEFLRSLIACLHSSSNQGFLGLELIEDLGIVFLAISKRVLANQLFGLQIQMYVFSVEENKEF